MVSSREWKRGKSKEITFIVTKDCQLACKYCYQVNKNPSERLSWNTAKKAVDFVLSQEIDELFDIDSIIFSFIGGEPFLEIDLIDHICDYLKIQMYQKNHRWFNSYRFAITTNGINYDNDKVQSFIKKNIKHLSITISIDGTQKKHDINRVWKNLETGSRTTKGSYENVVRNIPLWLSQFPNAATKVTISSADIPYICESVLHLFSLGIHIVYINCVFENVWHDGDDILFEEQLKLLADKIVDDRLFEDNSCSFFQRWIGRPIDSTADQNWCGAGLMLAIDSRGVLYPCVRLAKYSLRDKAARILGNLEKGIDRNLLRPYFSLTRSIQSSKECFECEVASGCAWCQAENYDCSASGTIFHRSTAICRMHKARVRANKYYWAKIDEIEGRKPIVDEVEVDNKCKLDKTVERPDTVIVLLSTKSTAFCISDNTQTGEALIPLSVLQRIVDQTRKESLNLQFVFPKQELPEEYVTQINSVAHHKITPLSSAVEGDATVLDGWNDVSGGCQKDSFYILRTTLPDFCNNVGMLEPLLRKSGRLNIIFTDEEHFCKENEQPYQESLEQLSRMVLDQWLSSHKIDVNILTDRLQLSEMDNCNAGWKSVTLAPNGKYYICPDFYYADEADSCGDIEHGLNIKDPLLYKLNHAPLCRDCGAYHCQRCVFLNKKKTLEVNIPSYEQCSKAEIELNVTKQFFEQWKKRKLS